MLIQKTEKLPYSLWSSYNKEFPFRGAQISVVGKTENPEYLAVLEVVEPAGEKMHYIYTCFQYMKWTHLPFIISFIYRKINTMESIYMAGAYQVLFCIVIFRD